MATLPFSATIGVMVSRFFSGSLWRSVLSWSEELNRAHVAGYRYEQLRGGQSNNVLRQDHASKARPVFAELYSGKPFLGRGSAYSADIAKKCVTSRPLCIYLEPNQGAKS
jgi:hypothetical protein